MTKLRHQNPRVDVWRAKYESKQNAIEARSKKLRKSKAQRIRQFCQRVAIQAADKDELLRIARFYAKGIKPHWHHYELMRKYRDVGLDFLSRRKKK